MTSSNADRSISSQHSTVSRTSTNHRRRASESESDIQDAVSTTTDGILRDYMDKVCQNQGFDRALCYSICSKFSWPTDCYKNLSTLLRKGKLMLTCNKL